MAENQQFYTRVPYNGSHSHFSNPVIESFPDLHAGPSYAEKENFIRETIKYQLLTTKPKQAERYYSIRQCFKFEHKSHVEHCLKHKVPGTSLEQAAVEAGYRKI